MTQPVPAPAPHEAGSSVADVLSRLDEVQDRPLAEHVEVFDGVHRALQAALSRLDEA